MIKVCFFYPCIEGGCWAADRCGEVNMNVFFKVSTKCVNSKEYPRDKSLLVGEFFDNIGSDCRYFVHKISVHPEEVPEGAGHGECDMLPFGIWEGVEAVFDPVVSGPFTTG